MRGKIFYSGVAILIFFTVTFQIIPDNVESVGAPVVTLRFEEGEEVQFADVAPGENGTVIFPGIVEAVIPAGSAVQDVVVSLMASNDMAWPTSVDPPMVQLSPGEQAFFTVSVSAPTETSTYILSTLTVSGTARSFPGAGAYNVPPIQGTIQINQFYKFSLSSDDVTEYANIGEKASFSLDITNYGNGRDTFYISINGINYFSNNDISVALSTTTIDIDEKSIRDVSISIGLPNSDSCLGTHNIEVEVKSQQQEMVEGTTIPQTFLFTLKVVTHNINEDDNDNQYYYEEPNPRVEEDKEFKSSPGFDMIVVITAILIIISVSMIKRRSSRKR